MFCLFILSVLCTYINGKVNNLFLTDLILPLNHRRCPLSLQQAMPLLVWAACQPLETCRRMTPVRCSKFRPQKRETRKEIFLLTWWIEEEEKLGCCWLMFKVYRLFEIPVSLIQIHSTWNMKVEFTFHMRTSYPETNLKLIYLSLWQKKILRLSILAFSKRLFWHFHGGFWLFAADFLTSAGNQAFANFFFSRMMYVQLYI